jgi:hypothetical protein
MTFKQTIRSASSETFKIIGDGSTQSWTFNLQYIDDPKSRITVKDVATSDFVPTASDPFVENTTVTRENLTSTQVKVTFGAAPTAPVPAKKEVSQFITDVTTTALTTSGTADYVLISSTTVDYYVWLNVTDGTTSDPAVGGRTGIQVDVLAADTAIQIATKVRDELNTTYPTIFWANNLDTSFTETATLNIEAQVAGAIANDAADGPAGCTQNWSASTSQQGADEVAGDRHLVIVEGILGEGTGDLVMILYTDSSVSPQQISAITRDGSLKLDISQDPSYAYTHPLPTKDGKYITYRSDKDGNTEIYFAELTINGLSNEIKVSNHAGAETPEWPHICDNNDLILWTTDTGTPNNSSEFRFYRRSTGTSGNIGVPGTSPTVYGRDVDRFSVSPDNRYIAMTSSRGSSAPTNTAECDLFMYSLEAGKDTPTIGRSFTQIRLSGIWETVPGGTFFNAAGDKLLFNYRPATYNRTYEITWTASTQSFGTAVQETPNSVHNYWPAYSPDETELVATNTNGTQLLIFDVDGTNAAATSTLTSTGSTPWWGTIPGKAIGE